MARKRPLVPARHWLDEPDMGMIERKPPRPSAVQLRALRRGAEKAGDYELAGLCSAALEGDEHAMDECAETIAYAEVPPSVRAKSQKKVRVIRSIEELRGLGLLKGK